MITIRHLSHRYPHARSLALDDISLNIRPGDCLGLLGANGAGKTTLMSLIAGLQQVQQGEIALDGQAQRSRAQQRQLSLVPQDFAFYQELTVWDNMRYFAALYDLHDPGHLRQLLAQTDLLSQQQQRAKHLSGGMKRRLNFAIGLINRPRLLFLDEITVGIDPESRQFILDSVAELRHNGVTILYTSHYLQEIEQLCNTLAFLHRGRLIHQGALSALIHSHTLQLATQPALSAQACAQLGGTLDAHGNACFADAEATHLLATLAAQGYTLLRCQFGYHSLESFYLHTLRQHNETQKPEK